MAVADVITHVRRLIGDEPFQTQLSAAYTAAATTISVDNPTALENGQVIDFPGANSSGSYEQMRVFDTTDPLANPITVQIGHNDTTNQNHADNAIVLVAPTYATDTIAKAITHVVDTLLYPDLFVVTSTTYTPSPSTTVIYDLPTDFVDVVDKGLIQAASGSIEDMVYLSGWEIVPVPSAIATGNQGLRVWAWPRIDVEATLFYKAKPTTTNMTATMEPVIALGVAWYLLKSQAYEKVDRFDEDDRPGRMQRLIRDMERDFNNEKRRVRQELLKKWGPPQQRFRHRRQFA